MKKRTAQVSRTGTAMLSVLSMAIPDNTISCLSNSWASCTNCTTIFCSLCSCYLQCIYGIIVSMVSVSGPYVFCFVVAGRMVQTEFYRIISARAPLMSLHLRVLLVQCRTPTSIQCRTQPSIQWQTGIQCQTDFQCRTPTSVQWQTGILCQTGIQYRTPTSIQWQTGILCQTGKTGIQYRTPSSIQWQTGILCQTGIQCRTPSSIQWQTGILCQTGKTGIQCRTPSSITE